ncbi:MAG: DnaJ family domain-containing protein [Actinomycetota bacterium]
MNIFESIADRRIEAARKAGLFDNLAGAGKPIPDLGQERPAGWWAARLAKRERSMMAAEDLDRDVRAAMPGLWRLGSEEAVRAEITTLNARIKDYNRVTTFERRNELNAEDVVAKWRTLRRRR